MSRRTDEELYEGTTPDQTPTGDDIVAAVFDILMSMWMLAVFLVTLPVRIYRWWKNRA